MLQILTLYKLVANMTVFKLINKLYSSQQIIQFIKTVYIFVCFISSSNFLLSFYSTFCYGITCLLHLLFQGGYLSDQQLALAEAKLYELLAALRPNAVALVDAFDFPDQVLDSDLGRYDGNVYEALMEYARRSKLNESEVRRLSCLFFFFLSVE